MKGGRQPKTNNLISLKEASNIIPTVLKYFSLNTFAAFLANVAIAQLREKKFAKICKNKLKFAKFYNPVLVHTLVPTAELYLIGSAHDTVLS